MKRVVFLTGILIFLVVTGIYFVSAENQIINVDYENALVNSFSGEIFSSSFILRVITDNDTDCEYSTVSSFTFGGGNPFDENFNNQHERTFTGLSPGVENYYVKCYDGNSQAKLTFKINPPVTGQIVLSEDAPLKAGRVDVTLVTSKPVMDVPSLSYSFDGLVYNPLTVVGSENTWKGYLIIDGGVGEELVSFKFRGKDLEGREGTEITNGAVYAIDTIKPRTVSAITAEGYSDEIELKWHFDGDYDKFNIYRSTLQNPTYTDFYDSADDEDFIDDSVSAGKTYYYKVSAVDDAGNEGDLSVEVYAAPSSVSGSSTTSGLALNLRGSVDSLLNEIDFAIGEVEDIQSSVSSKPDKEKELFSDLKFDAEIQKAIIELKSLRSDVDKFKQQDLAKDSLDQKISSSRLRIEVIKKKIPEGITILDEASKKEAFQDEDIREAILETRSTLDDSIVDKSVKQTLDLIETYPLSIDTDFYVIEVMYSDGTREKFTIVSKDISSKFEKSDNGLFIEVIPKDVIGSASDIDFKDSNYEVVKEDPVLSFGPDTKTIFYSFEGDSDIDSLKSIKTSFVSIAEEDESGNALTGYFLYDLGRAQYTWIIIGILLILSVGGYLFYKKRNAFSDSYFRLKKKIEEVHELLRNGDVESTQKEYKLIRDFYVSLSNKEKKAIYKDVDSLRNRIFVFKLEKGIRELSKTKDKNLFIELEKIYNSLSPNYKKKIEKVFLKVKNDFEVKNLDKKEDSEGEDEIKKDVKKGGKDVSK